MLLYQVTMMVLNQIIMFQLMYINQATTIHYLLHHPPTLREAFLNIMLKCNKFQLFTVSFLLFE